MAKGKNVLNIINENNKKNCKSNCCFIVNLTNPFSILFKVFYNA